MKFLVTWQLDLALLSREMAAALARVPGYAAGLERAGKVDRALPHRRRARRRVDHERRLARGARTAARRFARLQLLALRRQSAVGDERVIWRDRSAIDACSDRGADSAGTGDGAAPWHWLPHDLNRERHWTCARRMSERRHELGLTQYDVVERLAALGVRREQPHAERDGARPGRRRRPAARTRRRARLHGHLPARPDRRIRRTGNRTIAAVHGRPPT